MRRTPSYRRGHAAQTADLVVVGGGIVGVSIAVFAARAGLRVHVFERGALGGAATLRSGAMIRTHYENRADARLAVEGRELFIKWGEAIGGDPGFRRTGFVYLPGRGELATGALSDRVAMLRDVGSDAEMVDSEALRDFAPDLEPGSVERAVIEPESGYADPHRTMAALIAAARDSGAVMVEGEPVTRISCESGRVGGVTTTLRAVAANAVVLCCGAWAPGLAAGLGLELEIRPTAALPARFATAGRVGPAAIDVPNGVYFRSDGASGLLAGLRDWRERDLDGPDGLLPEVDEQFGGRALAAVARRVPAVAPARFVGGRSGPLDMTPDGRPLLGPTAVEGLWLSCGWSGTGFKTGPAAGRALVHWLLHGLPHHPDIRELAPGRLMTRSETRTPH
ncbi:MAG: FAD-binding oxidoreductase [Thermoleophilia bacterium]|nr:FAD-binding oxidoreductase [Thermoleophilia bacterium]MDH3725494.1 FAD-binding oxidoreductase [Thermoleophilia bacterium]